MEFVTFEIAKKLKEKGYPQHIADDAYIVDNYGEEDYQIEDILPIPIIPDFMDDVSAPRIDQVLKWLREEHKIYMYVKRDTYHFKFRFVYEKDKPRGEFTSSVYDGFEQAALAGIEYVLDNLI